MTQLIERSSGRSACVRWETGTQNKHDASLPNPSGLVWRWEYQRSRSELRIYGMTPGSTVRSTRKAPRSRSDCSRLYLSIFFPSVSAVTRYWVLSMGYVKKSILNG